MKLMVNDEGYNKYLKPYYDNLNELHAILGSLFSVNTSSFTDEEKQKYIQALIMDYLKVSIYERDLYHIIRKAFSLPENFYLNSYEIIY